MGRDYIPEADADAANWMRAFADGLRATPEAYMLTPPVAEHVGEVVRGFLEALLVSSNEATRTKVTVCAKDEKRAAAQRLCRTYAALIKHNLGIDDGLKVAIGVPPLRVSRSRRNVPASSPHLDIVCATPGMHVLRYHETGIPDSRAMPFGATSLHLYKAVGEGPKNPLSEARLCGVFTKNPVRVKHDPAETNSVATYYARWVSQRGEFGPWSLPASMTIAA
jgi:hypothetical protein